MRYLKALFTAIFAVSLIVTASPAQGAALPAPVACPSCWHPALRTSWQWQLSSLPTSPYLNVDMYDIDGFDAPVGLVSDLHGTRQGRKVVCYISAGSYEDWRPDAAQFPAAVLGKNLDGWAGERWLDIRQYGGPLGAIMRARLDMCKAKGFDAVEPDNVDGYTNKTGFPLTKADQLAYNSWLANEAHNRGLSVALKNDNAQIPQLLPYFDWALNEECFTYKECTTADNGGYGYDQFVAAGKAVMQVEYDLATSKFCAKANAQNFNSLKKHLELDAYRVACRGV
ncbi:endo alpha-1,4 polygalactosaminidase [Planotetraspora silvatica]|uniref:Endo alpha-1,4 polygalactosaminidase n=1 Tax=Planotetraspora silvatica TaxID=234614 RepID=A0A8J3UKV2_9ACTN|nr:endo alpha-1,4 polygalactosaminidase [Planotetraspora silvatica]GII46832.1 endo alpha-1,4 polygalactosaminidase [Planotetraspora silvatica]